MKKYSKLLALFVIISLFIMGQAGCPGCRDTTKPNVAITYPANNSTVSGIVTIRATATDNVGVVKVEFYIDGQKVGEDTSSPYEYSWNTDNLQYNSTHTIQAKAYDNAGNVGESPQITVTIGDTQAPLVTINSPGSTVPGSAIVQIQAQAVDRNKKTKVPTGIQKVEFYVDGTKIGEDTTSPYQYNWDTSGLKHNTTHTITVKAYDNANNIGEASTTTTINVEWTILMYLDGHNNLGPAIQSELAYLNNVTSTAGINVVILAGKYEADPFSYLYYAHNGILQTLSQGNYNFGDPALLQNFLAYGIQNFPAKKYLVVLKDHGSGWRNKAIQSSTRDICWDHIYNSSLTMPELKLALQSAVSLLGRKIDLMYFDACVMGTIEVDYEIKDLANYLVSSEATSYAGTRWDLILTQLVSNPTMTPSNLGILVAQTYFNNCTKPYKTIAVKDLSKIDTIANDIYYFAHYLRDLINTSASAIMGYRNQTTRFQPSADSSAEYIDLYQYANFIANNTNYSNLQNAALSLMSDITSSTLYWAYSGYPSAKGYSIWFPQDLATYSNGYSKYGALDFTQATSGYEWWLFLHDELTALSSGSQTSGTRIEK